VDFWRRDAYFAVILGVVTGMIPFLRERLRWMGISLPIWQAAKGKLVKKD